MLDISPCSQYCGGEGRQEDRRETQYSTGHVQHLQRRASRLAHVQVIEEVQEVDLRDVEGGEGGAPGAGKGRLNARGILGNHDGALLYK